MTTTSPDSLAILLHGVGSNGAGIGRLAAAWQSKLPAMAFAAPDAPHRSSFGNGYQWFSIAGVTEENRPGRIREARASFDATIRQVLDRHGFADRLDRVAFVGFSQGTIMSLDAIASGRWPIAGVLGYSGRLASPPPLRPPRDVRVMLVHGDADAVIPVGETPAAAASLQMLGLPVEMHILPGIGHTIDSEGAALGAAFLSGLFGRQAQP
jgi:phospholipase/carboxylesterase